MPPIPQLLPTRYSDPRVVLYQQTHHHGPNDKPVSLLPLLTAQQHPSLTHLILAAVHINPSPEVLTLNDHPPSDARFTQLWDEVLALQDAGIKVLCMLGGAAQGSFARLDYEPSELATLPPQLSEPTAGVPSSARLPSPKKFERYYTPLRDFIRTHNLQGIDLDVEEPTSLLGIIHLIDRLREDFGPSSSSTGGFTITLAPVATALIRGYKHLSGFSYFELERLRAASIDWYNVQFYNGWGSLEHDFPNDISWPRGWYDQIVTREGWRPYRLVLGLLTNPRHGGSGYVNWNVIARRLGELVERYPDFGGVMGWEYWEAVPEVGVVEGGEEEEDESHYWRWAWRMRWILNLKQIRDQAVVVAAGRSLAGLRIPNTASRP